MKEERRVSRRDRVCVCVDDDFGDVCVCGSVRGRHVWKAVVQCDKSCANPFVTSAARSVPSCLPDDWGKLGEAGQVVVPVAVSWPLQRQGQPEEVA